MTPRILVALFAYNEGPKVRSAIARHPRDHAYDLLVMDDGSTDGSLDDAGADAIVLRNATNLGVGAAMKRVFEFALQQNYDILVIQAGNDKDDPLEIPRLLDPILNDAADFVQGSRYLAGGRYGNMSRFRVLGTKLIHPWLASIVAGKRVTESTNGFRAFRTAVLRDPRMRWREKWLDRYELEPYLLLKAIMLGYRHLEVPVTKIYPASALGHTKMRPFLDWWSIVRPLVFLFLGVAD